MGVLYNVYDYTAIDKALEEIKKFILSSNPDFNCSIQNLYGKATISILGPMKQINTHHLFGINDKVELFAHRMAKITLAEGSYTADIYGSKEQISILTSIIVTISRRWSTNVTQNGDVCINISILTPEMAKFIGLSQDFLI